MAVLLVRILDQEELIIGPFATGDEASRYGFDHFDAQGIEWYWLPLTTPVTE